MFAQLLDLLGADRKVVAALWRELGTTRAKLEALLTAHREDLASAGVVLHVATVSQASVARHYVEVNGVRVAALSKPGPGRASSVAKYIAAYLDSMDVSIDELYEIRSVIDARIAQAPPVPATPRYTYHQQAVNGRMYWYGFWRDEQGKQHKKYIGKHLPDGAVPLG